MLSSSTRDIGNVTCPPGESFRNCGSTCLEGTCDGPGAAICPGVCDPPGCYCLSGLVRSNETGRCIDPRECPVKTTTVSPAPVVQGTFPTHFRYQFSPFLKLRIIILSRTD